MVKPVFENVIDMVGGLLKAEKKKKRKAKVAPAKFTGKTKEQEIKSKVRARPVFPPYVPPALPFVAPFAELREVRKRGRPPGPSKGKKAVLVAETAELEKQKASALSSAKLEASSRKRGESRKSESEQSSSGRSRKGTASSASSAESEFVSASEAEPAVRLTKKGLPFKKLGRPPKAKPEIIQSREEIERELGLSPLKVSVKAPPKAKAKASSEESKEEELPFRQLFGTGKFKKRK